MPDTRPVLLPCPPPHMHNRVHSASATCSMSPIPSHPREVECLREGVEVGWFIRCGSPPKPENRVAYCLTLTHPHAEGVATAAEMQCAVCHAYPATLGRLSYASGWGRVKSNEALCEPPPKHSPALLPRPHPHTYMDGVAAAVQVQCEA